MQLDSLVGRYSEEEDEYEADDLDGEEDDNILELCCANGITKTPNFNFSNEQR